MDPLESITETALKEIHEEDFRARVEECKKRLRERKPLLHRLIPFTVSIKWRTGNEH